MPLHSGILVAGQWERAEEMISDEGEIERLDNLHKELFGGSKTPGDEVDGATWRPQRSTTKNMPLDPCV